MEVVSVPEYIEDMPMHKLEPVQYLALVQRAVAQLQWHIVGWSGNSITCQVPNNNPLSSEIVSITIDGKNVTFRSRPINGFYWNELQSRQNAALLNQTIAKILEERDKANRNLHPMNREKYGALIPSKSYLVTPLINYANALVFIAMVLAGISPLNPTARELFQWGGNLRPAVTHGEWWRLLTYMFLHGGAMHLLMNTYALLYIGMFLEPLMGRFRFFSAYMLTGICAGLMSIAIHANSVGVGASGAIFGMYGVFLSMLTTSHLQKTLRKTMLRSILFFVLFNLLYGLQGNTDNAAHIGGLVSGFLIGYAYYPGISKHAPISRQALTTATIACLVVLVTVITIAKLQ